MQNLNNSNSIMSRRPGSRSETPNSMLVLEQGRESPTRPSSGRRSANRRSPLKRGGSSLEILPAEEEDTAATNGIQGPRQTQSAGSQSRLGFSEDNHDGKNDRKGSSRTQRRSNTNTNSNSSSSGSGSSSGVSDVRAGAATPDSPRKQVYLTTVKRNFEQHGMPKNEELAKAVQVHSPLPNGPADDSPPLLPTNTPLPQKQQRAGSSQPRTDSERHNSVEDAGTVKQASERLPVVEADPIEPSSERLAAKGAEAIAQDLERLEVKRTDCPRTRIRSLNDETGEMDSYYITHCSGNSTAANPSCSDSYYLSHGQSSSVAASVAASPPSGADNSYYLSHNKSSSATAAGWPETGTSPQDQAEEPTEQAGPSTAPASSNDDLKTDQGHEEDSDDEDEDQDEGDEEEEEEDKAPFQLLGEFLESVMEEDYENAEKLCKMVLLYEPDNAEAKQFQPLIEEMLKREREAQLWGSESDSDDDDSDEDEDEDSDDDEDSDTEDSDDDSSSDDEDDEEAAEGQTETEKLRLLES